MATTGKPIRLTDAQQRDLRAIRQGYTRGESASTCEALCRRGWLKGDWLTGYDLTPAGRQMAEAITTVEGEEG